MVIKRVMLGEGQAQRSVERSRDQKQTHTHDQLIFDKGAKSIQHRKKDLSLFNKWYWNKWMPVFKKKIDLNQSQISIYSVKLQRLLGKQEENIMM